MMPNPIPDGLRFISLLESSGYGNAAREYLSLLFEAGINVQWTPLVQTRAGYRPYEAQDYQQVKQAFSFIDDSLTNLLATQHICNRQLMHTIPELWPNLIDASLQNIGYTVWETDKLPAHWPELINAMDKVLVPCEFNREIFENECNVPVEVIPHICRKQPRPSSDTDAAAWRSKYSIPNDHFLFYTINAWSPRKAIWDALHAYLLAFDDSDPVTFIIKTDAVGPRDARDTARHPVRGMVSDICSNYPAAANVVLIDKKVPERDIELLHLLGDCFFSLTRSEGWGLGSFDAATLGNPVIMTGWGGQLDYLQVDLSSLVEYKLEPVIDARGYPSYNSSQNWARASIDHAIELLLENNNNPDDARSKAAIQQKEIKQRFSATTVRGTLIRTLSS